MWDTLRRGGGRCGAVPFILALACESSNDDPPLRDLSLGALGGSCGAEAASCQRDFEDPWTCKCNGRTTTREAPTCESALSDACAVAIASECQVPGLGLCSADDGAGYQCACETGHAADAGGATGGDVVVRNDDGCMLALTRACAVPCQENGLGRCEPTDGELEYDCSCDYYGADIAVQATDCRWALAACEPREDSIGDGCKDYVGICEGSGDTFDCHCTDGSDAQPSGAACDEALASACGHIEPPADLTCEGEVTLDGATWTTTCRKDLTRDEPTYACECTDGMVTVGWTRFPAETCAEALEQGCPRG